MKGTNVQKKLYMVIGEIRNTFENFQKKLDQQKEDSLNRIYQLEACLTATLDESEQCIHHTIPQYTDIGEAWMLIKEIEMLKKENRKLKYDMNEKEILTNSLTGKFNKERATQKWQTETGKNKNIYLYKYSIRNKN